MSKNDIMTDFVLCYFIKYFYEKHKEEIVFEVKENNFFSVNDSLMEEYKLMKENIVQKKLDEREKTKYENTKKELLHQIDEIKNENNLKYYDVELKEQIKKNEDQYNQKKIEFEKHKIDDSVIIRYDEYYKDIRNFIHKNNFVEYILPEEIISSEEIEFNISKLLNNILYYYYRADKEFFFEYCCISYKKTTHETLNYKTAQQNKINEAHKEKMLKTIKQLYIIIHFFDKGKEIFNNLMTSKSLYYTAFENRMKSPKNIKYSKKIFDENAKSALTLNPITKFIHWIYARQYELLWASVAISQFMEWQSFLKKFYNVDNEEFSTIDFTLYIFQTGDNTDDDNNTIITENESPFLKMKTV